MVLHLPHVVWTEVLFLDQSYFCCTLLMSDDLYVHGPWSPQNHFRHTNDRVPQNRRQANSSVLSKLLEHLVCKPLAKCLTDN